MRGRKRRCLFDRVGGSGVGGRAGAGNTNLEVPSSAVSAPKCAIDALVSTFLGSTRSTRFCTTPKQKIQCFASLRKNLVNFPDFARGPFCGSKEVFPLLNLVLSRSYCYAPCEMHTHMMNPCTRSNSATEVIQSVLRDVRHLHANSCLLVQCIFSFFRLLVGLIVAV